MEEIEEKFMELVRETHKKSGGANGISLYNLNKALNPPENVNLLEIMERLIQEKKIAYLNPLNGRTITLPK